MNDIKDLIYTVRGVKVMLDSDLAQLYDYTTKAFNQQVKNNIGKFDSDFRFQLTKEEYHEILRSKNLTLELENDFLRSIFLTSKDKRGGRQYLPYVFTEQGIYAKLKIKLYENYFKKIKVKANTFVRFLSIFAISIQPMRTVELKRKLQKYGCYFLTNGKNHEWWYSPITDQKFQVPRHASEDIRTPLKKQISKQSGVDL